MPTKTATALYAAMTTYEAARVAARVAAARAAAAEAAAAAAFASHARASEDAAQVAEADAWLDEITNRNAI